MALPYTLDGELRRRELQRDYSKYVQYVNPGFYMSHFHKYLCDKVQEFIDTPCKNGVFDILLLSVPPQVGKTYTVTETLPSWFLGKHPQDSVIIAGYEGSFAEGFSRRNRDKFNEYASDIFHVLPNKNVQGVALWETDAGGKCRAAGLKAGITGYPSELFIIDDPIKNREQAFSETVLSKIHDEMAPSVQSRIHPGGKLIVIQTRWVESDVIGWVQDNWSELIWADINIPCECEDPEHDVLHRQLGDALMGAHMGDIDIPQKICKDNTWLQGAKRIIMAADGQYTWNALYQGHPTAQEGNLFKESSWKFYRRCDMDISKLDYLQLSIDATFAKTDTADRVAMTMWGLYNNEIYLWRLINRRMGFVETVDKIKQLCTEYPQIDQLVIENKANGAAIIDTLSIIEGMPPIVGVNPVGGKYARAQAISPYVDAGIIHICTDWTQEELADVEPDNEQDAKTGLLPHQLFVKQLSHFPYAKHDDMVDSTSQGVARIIKLITGEEAVPHRKILRYTRWYPDMWEDFESMDAMEQERFIITYGAPLEWKEELA